MINTSLQMTIGDYLLYSLIGICVVFVALALIMLIIKVIAALEKPEAAGEGTGAVAVTVAAADAPSRPLAPGSAGNLKLYDTDPRDAAMIMAIIADELGKPLNELRFISIREVKE